MGDASQPTEGAAPARHKVAWDVNRMEAQRRMVIAEPLWVTSSRTTHVDVMCTSNTVRRYVAPGEKERQQSKSKARCRLPYASNASAASVQRNPGTATPTQRLMDEIARKKMNEAMHEERRCDLGVLRCCGAFTSLDGLVAIARCRGWSLFRF